MGLYRIPDWVSRPVLGLLTQSGIRSRAQRCTLAFLDSEGSDQPAHQPSQLYIHTLIEAYDEVDLVICERCISRLDCTDVQVNLDLHWYRNQTGTSTFSN